MLLNSCTVGQNETPTMDRHAHDISLWGPSHQAVLRALMTDRQTHDGPSCTTVMIVTYPVF